MNNDILINRIDSNNFLFNNFPKVLYTSSKDIVLQENFYKDVEFLYDQWYQNTELMLTDKLSYLHNTYPNTWTKQLCEEGLQYAKSVINEIKLMIYNSKLFYVNGYIHNYLNELLSNDKFLFSITRKKDQFVAAKNRLYYTNTIIETISPKNVNNIDSEDFSKFLIELAFIDHPILGEKYKLVNYKHEPNGPNQCPDLGWDVQSEDGTIISNLYAEIKSVLTILKKDGSISCDYNNAGKPIQKMEECFIPIEYVKENQKKKTHAHWRLNKAFFSITIFLHYIELEYIDDNNNSYKAIQYFGVTSKYLQQCICYMIDNKTNKIKPATKSNNNGNVLIKPFLSITFSNFLETNYGYTDHIAERFILSKK